MLYASDFRRIAREALTAHWGLAIGTGFVAELLGTGDIIRTSGFNWSENSNHGYLYENSELVRIMVPIVLGIAYFAIIYALITLFIGGAVQLGFIRFNKNLLDQNNPRFQDLFSRFGLFWRAFALRFLTGLYTFLWSLLLIIPGIIAAYSYAMAPYILEDHPNLMANEAISRSKDMMYGNKWRLFCLGISFIGWEILCIFSCGIGFLWLIPYVNAAYVAFYYDVSGKYGNKSGTDYQLPPENPPYYNDPLYKNNLLK